MKLTVIGCTGSMSGPQSAASCYLIQAQGPDASTKKNRTWSVALDLGPGSFGALWRHLDPCQLDALYISHGHADHMGDIISMHVHRRWGPGSHLKPLDLYGPLGMIDRVRQIDGVSDSETYEREFAFHTLRAGQPFTVGPMVFTPAQGHHSVESFGVRIDGPSSVGPGDVSLFYTGDTDEVASITQGARGVDLLLCEVGFTVNDSARGIHMDGVRAGRLASQAEVGLMVATHIQPWTDKQQVADELRQTWSGSVEFAASDREFVI